MSSNLISGRTLINVSFISVAKVFLIAFFIGAAAIILGALSNSNLLAIGGPLVVMLSYIFYVLKKDFTDVSIIVAGDSFYYLGFIFTLISLISSLMILSYNQSVSIHSVVGSFGAALTTTIVGLVARLCVTSFSIQANERRQKMEETLERSITQFTMQLEQLNNQVIASLTTINLSTQKQMDENVALIANSMKNLNEQINAVKINPNAISEPLTVSVDLILKSVQENFEVNKKAQKALTEANLVAVNELKAGANLIEDYVQKIDKAMSDSVQRTADSYAISISEIGKSIVDSIDNLKVMRLDVESGISKQFSLVEREIGSVQNGLKTLQKPIHDTAVLFTSSQHQLANNLEKLAKHSSELEAAMKKSHIDNMNLSEITKDIVSLQATLKQLNETLIDVDLSGGKAIDSLSQAAVITKNSTKQVAEDLSNVYQTLSTHLQRINKLD